MSMLTSEGSYIPYDQQPEGEKVHQVKLALRGLIKEQAPLLPTLYPEVIRADRMTRDPKGETLGETFCCQSELRPVVRDHIIGIGDRKQARLELLFPDMPIFECGCALRFSILAGLFISPVREVNWRVR